MGQKEIPSNPIYTCAVKMIWRRQYITWKKALRGRRSEHKKQRVLRRKPSERQNWTCSIEKLIIILGLTLKKNRFSFGVNLVLWYPRSTNLLFGPLEFEPNTNLGSLQIESLQHPFYILIYLFIFNIKYIINSLITLVFFLKKYILFDNPIKCSLGKPTQNK